MRAGDQRTRERARVLTGSTGRPGARHGLLVTYPDSLAASTRQQTYYFHDGLLRRLDYAVDILGDGPAVQYPSEYREFDGIMVRSP